MLLQAALISMVAVSEATQQICKGARTDCTSLPYSTGDPAKDAGCRNICAHQREVITEKTKAYYCEGSDQSCKEYDVYGRKGHERIFERHVMCVLSCQLVGQVESSSATSLKVCDDKQQSCLQILKKNGTFNAYKLCIPKCSGWTDPEKKKEHTAHTCTESNACQEGTYFTKTEDEGFESVKTCLERCLAE
nr:unnamed protein product [Spirometra erinaceieuropaei]